MRMNNESEMTGKDLKGIIQSLKSDEELVIDDEGIRIIKKED